MQFSQSKMELEIARKRSPEPSLCSFAYQFYSTIEGTLIGYLRRRCKATLQELIEHVANNKNLRTKHSKKYSNKNIEKLALSKLVVNRHIFIEDQNQIWTLNVIIIQEHKAMEYKLQKIVEIKKIKEIKQSRYESRAKKYKANKINCSCLKCDID